MGGNAYGQLGDGSTNNSVVPEKIATNVVAASAGNYFTLYVTANGELWGVGDNQHGQLGGGSTNIFTPVPCLVATNVVAASAGGYHSLFVTADGTLWTMGLNTKGELGNGITDSDIATGTNVPQLVTTQVVSVTAGGQHSLFIKSDGSLWGMGWGLLGQLGTASRTQINLPAQMATNVVAAAAGYYNTFFVTANGDLWGTGYNSKGQLGVGSTQNSTISVRVTTNVVAVAAGWYNTLFAKTDGSLWAMGDNSIGALGLSNSLAATNQPVQIPGLTAGSLGAMVPGLQVLAVAMNPSSTAAPIITNWPTASEIIYGQTLASSLLTNGLASTPGTFAFVTPGLQPDIAGVTNVPVVFTPIDLTHYTTVTNLVALTVNPAPGSVALTNLSQTYNRRCLTGWSHDHAQRFVCGVHLRWEFYGAHQCWQLHSDREHQQRKLRRQYDQHVGHQSGSGLCDHHESCPNLHWQCLAGQSDNRPGELGCAVHLQWQPHSADQCGQLHGHRQHQQLKLRR